MKRPLGYGVIAILLALFSASRLLGAVFWPSGGLIIEIKTPPIERLLSIAAGVAGVWAGWETWKYHRRAPELYALWAIIACTSRVYEHLVITPRLLAAMRDRMAGRLLWLEPFVGPWPLLLYAVVIGACYWYLRARRAPAAA